MSLLLYHFTAAHCIPKIRQRGLTKGALPWNLDKQGNPEMRRGFQWLTTNPDFAQPWCVLGNLPFPRNAYRITVLIPSHRQSRVFTWSELCRRCQPDCAEEINRNGGDIENWRVFAGPIPPTWFLEIARNTGQQIIAADLSLG